MTRDRENVAESLDKVIESIQSRERSGLLGVECYEEGRYEKGEIYFHRGRPTYAYAGDRVGQDALAWMLSWRPVHVSFLKDKPRPTTNIFPVVAPADPPSAAVSRELSPTWPRMADTKIAPATGSYEPNGRPAQATPFLPSSLPDQSVLVEGGANRGQNGANTPGIEWLIPQKRDTGQNVLLLPLTRPQRSIYLLVNGRRTVTDLARCVRKNIPEVERLLRELRDQGLVSF